VQQHTDPGAPFLITTAPRFAKGPVTSSDYLLQALGDDPANMQKRLGDGYYEQNLVMDQILQLTGRRSLNGDGDAMAQYTDLMAHAAAQAAQLGLSLGAPLTSSQIAALSSDIVWLVDTVVDGLTGPERRRRWSVDEKLALVRESFEAGKTVSMVARQHGLNPNQLFYWRKLYQDGSLSAVAAGEEVVAASQLANALRQIKELQRMLGKKTMEVEILREAIAVDRPKKWIARSPLSLEDTP
jgi:transposase